MSQKSFVENLAETIGSHANSQAIFGEPVEREGVTVIPVGKIRYGLGGGAGANKTEGEGSGGGGGVVAVPIGYIEMKEGVTRFKRINRATQILQVLAGLSLAGWVTVRGIREIRMINAAEVSP